MSGLLNKVKEAVTGTGTTNQGDNDYNNDRTDRDTSLTGSGTRDRDTYDSENTGGTDADVSRRREPHSSTLKDKLDPRVDSDGSRDTSTGYGSTGTGNTGYGSSTSGPHSSDLANKADPRVDSDNDGRRGLDSGNTGYGSTGSGNTGYGSTGTGNTGYGSSTSGPHSSNLANKVDPRVDSDNDGRRGFDTGNKSGEYGSGLTGTGTGSSGYGSSTGGGLAAAAGYDASSGSTGTSGITGHGRHGQAEDIVHGGAHYTETANKLDPHVSGGTVDTDPRGGIRIESDTSGTSGTSGISGTHDSSASGPHKSNIMSKLDPRVDSDRDGSKTYGGNQTTGSGNAVDVATTDPSVVMARLGEPKNADPAYDLAGRHGNKLSDDLRKYGNGIE